MSKSSATRTLITPTKRAPSGIKLPALGIERIVEPSFRSSQVSATSESADRQKARSSGQF